MKVACISLGCDKNRVDTEYLLAQFVKLGYDITQTLKDADIIAVNTCAFLESSRREAVNTILEAANEKQAGQKLFVAGCLTQRYLADLKDELPEVDAFLSINSCFEIENAIEVCRQGKRFFFDEFQGSDSILSCHDRVVTTAEHFAYLKVADGCQNKCTYCLIPAIRGQFRSKPVEECVKEAKLLVEKGVKELILVAQDLTNYGQDIYGKPMLAELIRELSKTDVKWIRLLYCYPERVTEELISEIASNDKVVKYIDIPLQHVSDKILKLMGRKSNKQSIERLIATLRKRIPDIAIRTTFITGFPFEGKAEFDELKAFLTKYKLDNAGFFAYSDEEEAPSFKLKNKVSSRAKIARLKSLFDLSERIIFEKLDQHIGKDYEVLCDGIDFEEGKFFARAYFQAPEIDTKIILTGSKNFAAGEFFNIKIISRDGYNLLGVLL